MRLSHRYIPARQLPDKSVSLLDTASARVAISQHAVPAEVEDSRRRIEALETELEIIAREAAVGVDVKDREDQAQELLTAERERLSGLEERWNSEKELVDRILEIRSQLRGTVEKVEGTESDLEKAADEAAEDVSIEGEPPRLRSSPDSVTTCSVSSESCRPSLANCRARARSSFPPSTNRPSLRLLRIGRAFRLDAWSRTRSKPSWVWPTSSTSGSSVRDTESRWWPSGFRPHGPDWTTRTSRSGCFLLAGPFRCR